MVLPSQAVAVEEGRGHMVAAVVDDDDLPPPPAPAIKEGKGGGRGKGRRAPASLPPTQIDSMNHAARDMDAVESFLLPTNLLPTPGSSGIGGGHAEMAQVQANGATRKGGRSRSTGASGTERSDDPANNNKNGAESSSKPDGGEIPAASAPAVTTTVSTKPAKEAEESTMTAAGRGGVTNQADASHLTIERVVPKNAFRAATVLPVDLLPTPGGAASKASQGKVAFNSKLHGDAATDAPTQAPASTDSDVVNLAEAPNKGSSKKSKEKPKEKPPPSRLFRRCHKLGRARSHRCGPRRMAWAAKDRPGVAAPAEAVAVVVAAVSLREAEAVAVAAAASLRAF